MNVRELYRALDYRIPHSLSCDWDNDGLMCCPDSSREVKRVLIALDGTSDTIDYAIKGHFSHIIVMGSSELEAGVVKV